MSQGGTEWSERRLAMSSACADLCRCKNDRGLSSILYQLLRNDGQELPLGQQDPAAPSAVPAQGCPCKSRRKVVLKCPHITCTAASVVLAKTLSFVRNVPCFQALPCDDQLKLVRRCWAPLLVLGLAQDKVEFETVETSEPSILQTLLTHGLPNTQEGTGHQRLLSAAETQTIQRFLVKCWSLDISPKEYAYLKGILLFNPELPGLHCTEYIQSLQQEARQALNEYVKTMYTQDQTRFFSLIIALSMLRSITASVIVELFFRPTGNVNIEDKLLDTLCAYSKPQATEKTSTY
ncbi:nuclear receptor subfamily 0 group B member 1 [Chiloscyllium plagiosum]|uniref:nuclear receptor subfamily 0 group B member 1 n=1 Tax=Chiloscyllium plagiosum TaxID=36176 RepID=UPI001CB81CC5|nr:nuclear receptor subfamily 0 group B member 1 [Chiloscyllium plagiosum]